MLNQQSVATNQAGVQQSLEDFPDVDRIRGCLCTFTDNAVRTQDYVTHAMACTDYTCLVIYTAEGAPFGYHGNWGSWHWSNGKNDIVVHVKGHGTCTIHNIKPPS